MKKDQVQKIKTFAAGVAVGGVLVGGGVYASTVSASNVSYSNSSSGISASSVQSAVDSIYTNSACLARERQGLLTAIYTMNEYYRTNSSGTVTTALTGKISTSGWYTQGSQMTWMANQVNTCIAVGSSNETHRNCMMTNIKQNYKSICSTGSNS